MKKQDPLKLTIAQHPRTNSRAENAESGLPFPVPGRFHRYGVESFTDFAGLAASNRFVTYALHGVCSALSRSLWKLEKRKLKTRRCPMIWSSCLPTRPRSSVNRRAWLSIDCLEDRFAPASLAISGGELASADVPVVADVQEIPLVNFQAKAPDSVAGFDNVPFGFFHPFCRIAFGGGELIVEEPAAPMPAPVMPPMLEAVPVAPTSTAPAAIATPTPEPSRAATYELLPAPERAAMNPPPPAPAAPPVTSSLDSPIVDSEPIDSADEEMPVPPPVARGASRHGLAALGGVMAAAGLLYVHNARERRIENDALSADHVR